MTAILGFIHVIFIPIYLKWRKIDQRNIWARIGNSLYPIFTFNVYVRIFISAYITILFSWFGEMYEFQVKTVVEITSYCFNILICVIIFAFYGLWIWQIKKAHPKLNSVKQFCFIEFFSGFKDKTTSRIYSAIFFSQRILSWLLVITSESLSLSTKMAILSVIQFLSLWYLLISRPYEKAKDLISEWLSQSVMTFFCWILIYFNTRSQWNSVINWIFMGTLMTSTAISTLIAFIDLLIIIVKKIRNSCWDDKVRHFRANRPSEVSHIGPDFVNAILKESEAIRKSKEENKESLSSKLHIQFKIKWMSLYSGNIL